MARNLKLENDLYCRLKKEEERAKFWSNLKRDIKVALTMFGMGIVIGAFIVIRIGL